MLIRAKAFTVLGWLHLTGATLGFTQGTPPTEYQIKAAFIYNFAKFVEWPAETLPQNAPFVIGILGENPFGNDLEKVISNKTINNHPIEIRKAFASLSEATNCHILFVSPSEKGRLAEIIDALRQASVLTIGETEGFTEGGGMINFVVEAKRIRFQINDEAAKKAKLKISSKLLTLASRPAG